ncbi:MAG TPA: hypothetical protein VI688_05960 [Anaerolineales bacterium]|nr:hypothetical protein [Anaerolineales bacterium]
MRELSGDTGVFIRSMASRGSLGGLAAATSCMRPWGAMRLVGWPSFSMPSRARSAASTPGRSALLSTRISAISRMPALMACTSSPRPGASTTRVV